MGFVAAQDEFVFNPHGLALAQTFSAAANLKFIQAWSQLTHMLHPLKDDPFQRPSAPVREKFSPAPKTHIFHVQKDLISFESTWTCPRT
jgi:hypothetical protein